MVEDIWGRRYGKAGVEQKFAAGWFDPSFEEPAKSETIYFVNNFSGVSLEASLGAILTVTGTPLEQFPECQTPKQKP